jgi:hypothetical protein
MLCGGPTINRISEFIRKLRPPVFIMKNHLTSLCPVCYIVDIMQPFSTSKQITLTEALTRLEIPPNHPKLNFFKKPSPSGLVIFKNLIRKQRRNLAKKYHPDLGLPIQRMQEINNLCDMFMSIKLVFRPRETPPPTQYTVHVYQSAGWGDNSTTTGGYPYA